MSSSITNIISPYTLSSAFESARSMNLSVREMSSGRISAERSFVKFMGANKIDNEIAMGKSLKPVLATAQGIVNTTLKAYAQYKKNAVEIRNLVNQASTTSDATEIAVLNASLTKLHNANLALQERTKFAGSVPLVNGGADATGMEYIDNAGAAQAVNGLSVLIKISDSPVVADALTLILPNLDIPNDLLAAVIGNPLQGQMNADDIAIDQVAAAQVRYADAAIGFVSQYLSTLSDQGQEFADTEATLEQIKASYVTDYSEAGNEFSNALVRNKISSTMNIMGSRMPRDTIEYVKEISNNV